MKPPGYNPNLTTQVTCYHRPLYAISGEFTPVRGGIGILSRDLSQALNSLRPNFHLFAPKCSGVLHEPDPSYVTRWRHRGTFRGCDLLTMARQWERCSGDPHWQKAEVLFLSAHVVLPLLLRRTWWASLSGPRVVLFHGSDILRGYSRPWWRKRAVSFFLRCHGLVFVSKFTRGIFFERFPECAQIPHGVVHPGAGTHATRTITVLPPRSTDELRVLTVARIVPRKGHDRLILAAAQLPETLRRRVRLLFAGSGAAGLQTKLQKMALAHRVQIEWLGEVPDDRLPSLLASCDLFCLPSMATAGRVEGFGIAAREALWHGLPVLGFAHGGLVEAVPHNTAGLLAPEGDDAAFAALLRELLSCPETRKRLGEQGRELARRRTWTQAAREILSYFSDPPVYPGPTPATSASGH